MESGKVKNGMPGIFHRNTQIIVKQREKRNSFFCPSFFPYERGRFPIEYFSEEENIARAMLDDIYSRYKDELKPITENRPNYLMPVIRILSGDGKSTYARTPPGFKCTAMIGPFWGKDLLQKESVQATPKIPDVYDYEKPNNGMSTDTIGNTESQNLTKETTNPSVSD